MRTAGSLSGLYWHYFTWQRTMKLTTLVGIGLLLLALLTVGHPLAMLPLMLGLIFALMFPTVFAGVAYRLLIANKRLLLVPHFRTIGALALLLIALTCAIVAGLFATAFDRGPAQIVALSLAAFSFVSAHLLLTQWFVTRPTGLLALPILPVLLGPIATGTDLIETAALSLQLPIAVAAIAGWVWLFRTLRSPIAPAPVAALAWLRAMSGEHSFRFPTRGIDSPEGTLLRAAPDSWGTRLTATIVYTFLLVVSILLIVLLTSLVDGEYKNSSIPYLLLAGTFLGLVLLQSAGSAEWPARLRLLWLRTGGDRQSGWQRIEQALLQDTMIIGLMASVIAACCLWLSDLPPEILLLYVAATVTTNLLFGYLAFWARARAWPAHVPQLLIGLALLAGFFPAFVLTKVGALSFPWTGLAVAVALLTPAMRVLARRQLLRIDWCAVRPTVRGRSTR